MVLTPGTHLGAYEILSPLGGGGMGEVYRGRDTRLGREVAIKVVSEGRTNDSNALARFQREARTVAALSHPNIVALHDIGSENGVAFIVMELLEGESLNQCIAPSGLSCRRALEIGASIADALASAHGRGVVHRDLKPANIFVTREGHIKVLDFGLAKHDPFRTDVPAAGPTRPGVTEPGMVLGTVAYMSPEQAQGEPSDQRSDIFSLGCVLYEMLSGHVAFPGATAPETLAAILRDDPPALAGASERFPASLDAVVRRCLEKEPGQRFQSARDLAFSLREMLGASESSANANHLGAARHFSRRSVAPAPACLVLATDRRFGPFTFHADRRQLLRDGANVHLTPKAFDLLALLIERAPAVVPKPEIHVCLWPDTFVSDATLVGLVKELRRALHDDHQGAIVRTAHRVGYAFADPSQAGTPSRAATRASCWLEAGPRRIPLQEGITTIGRDPASTIWLDVAGVSRRHVQIVVEHGGASLEDLGSKNGTLVCDRPVRGRVSLYDGDHIQVATERLVFHAADGGVPTVTQPVRPSGRDHE